MERMFKDWANPFAFRFILPHISHRDRDNPMERMFKDWANPFARLLKKSAPNSEPLENINII